MADRIVLGLPRGQNVLVSGEAGSGKTTLGAILVAGLVASGVRASMVDAGPWDDARDLVDAVKASVGRDPRRPRELLRAPGVSFGNPLGPREVSVRRGLNERDLQPLVGLDREDGHRVVVVDNLPGEVGHELFGSFRDTIWQAPITWVALVRDTNELLDPPADTFWERRYRIGSLDRAAVEDLIGRRVATAPTGDRAAELVGRGLSTLLDQLHGPTPRVVIAALANAVEDDDGLAVIPGDPIRLQRAEAAGGRAAGMALYEVEASGHPVYAGDEQLLQTLGIGRSRLSQILKVLEGAGLLRSFPASKRKMYEAVR